MLDHLRCATRPTNHQHHLRVKHHPHFAVPFKVSASCRTRPPLWKNSRHSRRGFIQCTLLDLTMYISCLSVYSACHISHMLNTFWQITVRTVLVVIGAHKNSNTDCVLIAPSLKNFPNFSILFPIPHRPNLQSALHVHSPHCVSLVFNISANSQISFELLGRPFSVVFGFSTSVQD